MFLFKGVKNYFYNNLGLSDVSKSFKSFTLMHIVFMIFCNFQSVFVNTLIIRVTGNSDSTLYMNMYQYLFFGILSLCVVLIAKKIDMRICTVVGIILFAFMYLCVFIFMDYLQYLIPVIGFLIACANAFYWLTYVNFLGDFTTNENRDSGMSIIGFGTGIVSLLMPIISGNIISFFADFIGYYILFGFSLVMGVLSIILVFKIPKTFSKNKKTFIKTAYKNIFKNKCLILAMSSEGLRGVREGTFAFFLNVLLFEYVRNESLVGFNSFLVGAATIFSFYIARKIIRPNNRIKSMFVATTVLLITVSLLFFGLNPFTIIMLSLINGVFNTFLINPCTTVLYYAIEKSPDGKKYQTEYLAIKDGFLSFGRILGVLLILIMPSSAIGYVIALFILTLSQYITVLLSKLTVNSVKKL